jgi:hypothetical protein
VGHRPTGVKRAGEFDPHLPRHFRRRDMKHVRKKFFGHVESNAHAPTIASGRGGTNLFSSLLKPRFLEREEIHVSITDDALEGIALSVPRQAPTEETTARFPPISVP